VKPTTPAPVRAVERVTARWLWLASLGLGLLLFVWQLGATGLVDETPPLFAASARGMAETGNWLIPWVNGLPRYDKPPLVYWAMGLLYSLPGPMTWDPLGTWAARLPSAMATVAVMQTLVHTLLRWPQARRRPGLTALSAALAFALSPLVLIWGRIAVSDALFSGCLAISLLLCWGSYASGGRRWWAGWLLLGLAVLAKGPVAVVLLGLTLLGFGWLQRDLVGVAHCLRPLRGGLITLLVAGPWYGLALLREGEPFWSSFFGYHNLQRFSSVVNNHQAPWWLFGLILVLASLPATPLLLLGLVRALREPVPPPAQSLQCFAACWLLAVLLFFTAAATKLPSYWLPATPAAALLIALAAQRGAWLAWRVMVLLTALVALVLALAPRWVPAIVTPEMPTLPEDLLASGLLPLAAGCFALASLLGLVGGWRRGNPAALVASQLPLVAFVLAVLLPLALLGDRLRAEPVRRLAASAQRLSPRDAPSHLAMVGMLKPSLHFYGRRVVVYEEAGPRGMVNLSDRLASESRQGQTPSPADGRAALLLVIDADTAAQPHWQGLEPERLDQAGIYRLWRLDRRRLAQRAAALRREGWLPNWLEPRPERY
jgi:4-amino-4-deoxy-L-arabinose transferase-like glycosyltransferase